MRSYYNENLIGGKLSIIKTKTIFKANVLKKTTTLTIHVVCGDRNTWVRHVSIYL